MFGISCSVWPGRIRRLAVTMVLFDFPSPHVYLYGTACFHPKVTSKCFKLLYVFLSSGKIYKDLTLLNVNPAKLNIDAEEDYLAKVYLV